MLRIRVHAALYALVTVGLGLGSRADGLPAWVHAYVGDALYAVLITQLFRLAFPRAQVALPALVTCVCVELSQLWHPAWLDTLRAHRLGALVLGRGFLWSDLVCYAAGVAAVVGLERVWAGISRRSASR